METKQKLEINILYNHPKNENMHYPMKIIS